MLTYRFVNTLACVDQHEDFNADICCYRVIVVRMLIDTHNDNNTT